MKRFALFMLVLAFCTHCTKGRSPSTIEDEGQTKTSTAASQQQTRTGTAQRATVEENGKTTIEHPANGRME